MAQKIPPLALAAEQVHLQINAGVVDPHTRSENLQVLIEFLQRLQIAEVESAADFNDQTLLRSQAATLGITEEAMRAKLVEETGADPQKVKDLSSRQLRELARIAKRGQPLPGGLEKAPAEAVPAEIPAEPVKPKRAR